MKKNKCIVMLIPLPLLWFFVLTLISIPVASQDSLPYYQIPDPPSSYTAAGVVGRMVDGLGFRYYWATEGLTPADLEFKPGESNRTLGETLDHIYGLSSVILNAALKKPNEGAAERPEGFDAIRSATLRNLAEASALFKQSENLEEHVAIFVRPSGNSEFPFWNMINGPIEDAVWHCGQVVSYRRASGNPMPPGVSVFRGTKRNN